MPAPAWPGLMGQEFGGGAREAPGPPVQLNQAATEGQAGLEQAQPLTEHLLP